MKALMLAVCLCLVGCTATITAPTPPTAPGYNSSTDQALGSTLAGIVGFVNQEKLNYAALTPAQQATEKPYLNALINAVDVANAAYMAYHQGTQTLAQAQTAVTQAQTAQTAFNAHQGVN